METSIIASENGIEIKKKNFRLISTFWNCNIFFSMNSCNFSISFPIQCGPIYYQVFFISSSSFMFLIKYHNKVLKAFKYYFWVQMLSILTVPETVYFRQIWAFQGFLEIQCWYKKRVFCNFIMLYIILRKDNVFSTILLCYFKFFN